MAASEECKYRPPPLYELEETDKDTIKGIFGGYASRIFFSEEKFVTPRTYLRWHEKYQNFPIFPSDVWVASLPKAGTTWTQEMVWSLMNNFDYKKGESELLMKRFPFFEWDGILTEELADMTDCDENDPCSPGVTWKILNAMKQPRTIKTHLLKGLLPTNIWKGKVIYVCRDPKDICISYYYHEIKLDGYTGDFDTFFDLFLKDLHFYCPIWEHILGYWSARHKENVLFIRYEELKEDLPKMCQKVAKFLGIELDEKNLASLTDHLSFSSMSKNRSTNNEALMTVSNDTQGIKFMRKGKVGDWRAHFSKEQTERFRKWTEEKLKDSDFPYYRDF